MTVYKVIDTDISMNYAIGEEVIGSAEADSPNEAIAKVMNDLGVDVLSAFDPEGNKAHVLKHLKAVKIWVRGDKVQVPHKGRMTTGTVVRHDPGESYQGKRVGTEFYVVDVGEYASIKVPKHKVRNI